MTVTDKSGFQLVVCLAIVPHSLLFKRNDVMCSSLPLLLFTKRSQILSEILNDSYKKMSSRVFKMKKTDKCSQLPPAAEVAELQNL